VLTEWGRAMDEPARRLSDPQAGGEAVYSKPLECWRPTNCGGYRTVAAKQHEIETLILTTPEAASVILPEASIEASLMEIRGRYGSDEDFNADLDASASTRHRCGRRWNATWWSRRSWRRFRRPAAAVSDTEVEIFWFMHKDRFRRAETRVLRHILVTINEQLAGNERPAARARIEAIRPPAQGPSASPNRR
jgi:peptidyl-prolyl cis-trans isomerase C